MPIAGVVSGVVTVAPVVTGLFGSDTAERKKQDLIAGAAARPNQIPTLAATGRYDERGNVRPASTVEGARRAAQELGCQPVPTGQTVRSVPGAAPGNDGAQVPVSRCGTPGVTPPPGGTAAVPGTQSAGNEQELKITRQGIGGGGILIGLLVAGAALFAFQAFRKRG